MSAHESEDNSSTIDPDTGEIGAGWGPPEQEGGRGSAAPGGSRKGQGSRSNGGTSSSTRTAKSRGDGEPERITTLTLASIDPARRPNPPTVCMACPAAVWMATPRDVKCFCRLMHYWSWETSKPNELTHCDGLAIASEREENS